MPGCEPRPEVRQVLDGKLSQTQLDRMKFAERVVFRRRMLEDLIAKFPRQVEPYRRLIEATKQEDTENYPALVDRTLAPDFPWPALELAGIYSPGNPSSTSKISKAVPS